VILSCEKDARLVYGLKNGTELEEFTEALKNGKAERYLNYVDVSPGDVFNIYPGLVHGIGKGIVLAEIQQNSNTTYRLYDYDRVDDKGEKRELHLEKALDVICTENRYPFIKIPGYSSIDSSGNVTTGYVMKEQYVLEKMDIENELVHDTANERFYVYFVTEGEGGILSGKEDIPVKRYETIMIPAGLGEYRIRGRIKLLRAHIRRKEEINALIHSNFAQFKGKLPIAT
jgi:mannose-6-phosphate isomerase